jgi:hypothetical protein
MGKVCKVNIRKLNRSQVHSGSLMVQSSQPGNLRTLIWWGLQTEPNAGSLSVQSIQSVDFESEPNGGSVLGSVCSPGSPWGATHRFRDEALMAWSPIALF